MICLLAGVFPVILSAQDGPLRRNELGLDISGMAVGLLGGNRNQSELTLTYKRLFGDWAFRTSLYVERQQGETHRLAAVQGDLLRFHRHRDRRNAYIGRIGLERRQSLTGRTMLALGMDLVYGQSQYDSRVQAFLYRPGEDTLVLNPNFPVTGLEFVSEQPWEYRNSTTHRMGLDATAALLFPIGDRLMLSAKVRTSLHYYLQTNKMNLFGPEGVTTTRSRELAFTMGPRLFSELNLYYRF